MWKIWFGFTPSQSVERTRLFPADKPSEPEPLLGLATLVNLEHTLANFRLASGALSVSIPKNGSVYKISVKSLYRDGFF